MMSLARGPKIYDPSEGSEENILTATTTAAVDARRNNEKQMTTRLPRNDILFDLRS